MCGGHRNFSNYDKNYGNEKVIFSVFDLKIATIAERGNEFPRTMVVVLDFRI
jgi:hypothetical protein